MINCKITKSKKNEMKKINLQNNESKFINHEIMHKFK